MSRKRNAPTERFSIAARAFHGVWPNMGRRPRNRMELRAEAEAVERLGLNTKPERKSRTADPADRRPKPSPAAPRMRVVWAVCDVGGRTVASFDYSDKATAEAHAAELKAKGKGMHFVRSVKEPM